ncbi:MAG: S8 family serine peptidase [Candidatus Limnocylindrales bacterium]
MRGIVALGLAALLTTTNVPFAAAETLSAGQGDGPPPPTRDTQAGAANAGMTTVIVTMRSQTDLRSLPASGRAASHEAVIQALQDHAAASRGGVVAYLVHERALGRVGRVTPFWVFNGLSITATPDVIRAIAARPDVASVTPDAVDVIPAAGSPAPGAARTPASASVPPAGTPEANIGLVNAPAVWSLGYTGQGIVVASLDSGVDLAHPDLATRWRGGSNSWFDPYGQHPTVPTDLSGHGTATMGVILGGDAGGTTIGMAPGATWIAAKIFSDGGTATATAIHAAFQWVLDPDGDPATADAPQVVNNSWSFGSPGCNLAFQLDLQALRAAEIVPVFAAGNFGPSASTSVSPANYPEALAVGATDDTDVLDAGSSRGPSACGETAGTYPELVAPGVDIRTADLFGLYQSSSGTSLAAPHVSGALALLLSAHPGWGTAAQVSALTGSAVDLGPAGPDDGFGYGRLDVLAANGATPPTLDTVGPVVTGASGTPTPSQGAAAIAITAMASDPASPGGPSQVAAAEWFQGADPGPGAGTPLAAADGAFDATMEVLAGSVVTTGLAFGEHLLLLRARDAAGNWGQTTPLVVSVTPADGLFADGFESGSVASWSSASGGSRLAVTSAAAVGGDFGLTVVVSGTGGGYVADATPSSGTAYRARFSFAANGMATPKGAVVTVFAGRDGAGATVFSLQYRRTTSGVPQVRVRVKRRGGTSTGAWVSITDTPTSLELAWAAAKGASASLLVGGSTAATLTGLDTAASRLEEVRLGPSAGLTAKLSGRLSFDRFVSDRTTPLGP